MAERWVVQVESQLLYDVWHTFRPLYVSEEVARLAIKYHWAGRERGSTLRVRRVA